MTRGWLVVFALISGLVLGGLGWVTYAALRLEHEQLVQHAAAEHADKVRLALWRLDGRLTALLSREDSRPFNHFSAIYAPPVALSNTIQAWQAGAVIEPSPLLSDDLPPWMKLHFQTSAEGWESPQVLSRVLDARLRAPGLKLGLDNVTDTRRQLLVELSHQLPPCELLATARRFTAPMTTASRVRLAMVNSLNVPNYSIEQRDSTEYASRAGNESKLVGQNLRGRAQTVSRDVANYNCSRNGEEWLNPRLMDQIRLNVQPSPGEGTQKKELRPVPSTEAQVLMTSLAGIWVRTGDQDHLMAIRLVKLDGQEICQGIVLDHEYLINLLAEEIADLLPEAEIVSVHEPTPELLRRSLVALPLALEPGEPPAPEGPGWSPLRVGLGLSWAAALVALLAVGLGGWSLLDLSARRIGFVSAVTHELRSPLTTLRLYLDLLMSGMVREESQREEYIRTLHAETDRLARLVTNVLEFSRLEKQTPQLSLAPVEVSTLLAEIAATWQVRCETAGKDLIVECEPGLTLTTDACLLGQVLGNLLDNACKYSRDAEDRRIWLRARLDGANLILEVEDRGPGVPTSERTGVFRPFQRGREKSSTTGGVGLGLALGRRWVRLLGGRLSLEASPEEGACFRVTLTRR